ncbi:MAG: hypothetical protein K0U47_11990 [Epsilonproteobacteria bacterium]|nr:hypothetical protein [Campylobacterota bacterium]
MTIEKLLEVTKGACTHAGQKKEVHSVSLFCKKISQNDLFIGNDTEEIQEALVNGAAAIIYDGEPLEIETDSVLIQVESIQDAALKLLAYVIEGDEELYIHFLHPHTLTFFKMIQLERKNVEYIPENWKRAFETILNSDKAIFLGDNEAFLKAIKPKIKQFSKSAFGYNIEDTLFRSTFRVDKFVYQHKKMVPFHLPYLLEAVALCEQYNLPYSIDRLTYTKHFLPIFIDGETGQQKEKINDHVVIVTDNFDDITEGREYAKEAKVTVSKSIVFAPPKVKIEAYTNPTIFKDPVSLVTAVKTTSFNYGFVYSKNREDYEALKAYFNA